jgi:hypothetical protein
MGQNAQALFKTPEQVRAERLKQQQAMYASAKSPYESMGMALGNILSTAFGVKDPELERASNFQSIYNSVLAENPDITSSSFYNTLAQQLAAAGLGAEAQYAMQESYKYRKDETAEQRAIAADERESRRVAIQEEQLLLQQVDKDPYGALERALAYNEDDPRRMIIIMGASAKIGERNTQEHLNQVRVQEAEAKTRLAEAQIGQVGKEKPSETVVTKNGFALTPRDGKYYTPDPKTGKLVEYQGEIKKLRSSSNLLDDLQGTGAGTDGKGGADNEGKGGEKSKSLSESIFGTKKEDTAETTSTASVRSGRGRPVSNRVSSRPPEFILRGTNRIKNKAYDEWTSKYGATHNPDGTPK